MENVPDLEKVDGPARRAVALRDVELVKQQSKNEKETGKLTEALDIRLQSSVKEKERLTADYEKELAQLRTKISQPDGQSVSSGDEQNNTRGLLRAAQSVIRHRGGR